jgi:hypothetical protein
MALPTQPFAGGGGYGPTMAPGYLEMAGREAERITQERNQRNESAINAVGGLLGGASGMDPGMVNAMFPSAMSQYYAQSSELDKKSNAMKKMLELNPEMFGLNKDQVKQMGDVTSKMSSTERSAFFQTYVPDLFKAQQAKLEQDAAYRRAVAGGGGGDSSLMYNNPSDVFQSYFSGTPTQPKSPPRAVPMGAPVQSAPPRAVPVSRGLDMNNMGFGQQEVISPW